MTLFRVARPFSSDQPHKSGDVLDLETGAHLQKLIEQRYLVPLSERESATILAERGRGLAVATVSEPKAEAAPTPVKRGPGRPKRIIESV